MNQLQRHDFPVTLKAHNPAPKTELDFTTPFELLIAVMLSAQATEVSINKATKKLYPTVNTAETLFALGVEELKPYIKTIGLFNYKAENVIKTCRLIIDTHSSEVPESREALEALPGVGRKTAIVMLNIAFNRLLLLSIHIYSFYLTVLG
jgi:endonuclease-3